jgi:hypothetical protein
MKQIAVNEPMLPGWYAYSGGAQLMVFHLRQPQQWTAHFEDGTAHDCEWGYIEQALSVWNLVRLTPPAHPHGNGNGRWDLLEDEDGAPYPGPVQDLVTAMRAFLRQVEPDLPMHLAADVSQFRGEVLGDWSDVNAPEPT